MSFWANFFEAIKCVGPKFKAFFGPETKAETRTREDLTKREVFREMVRNHDGSINYLVQELRSIRETLEAEREECRRGTERLERENAALSERCEKLERLVAELKSQINPPGHPLL